MSRNKLASKTVNTEVGALEITFEQDAGNIRVRLSDLTTDIVTRLALHGLSQKLGDSYSGVETPKDAYEAAFAQAERLLSGEWTATREGGQRVSDLAIALSRVTGQSTDECVAKLAEMDRAKKMKLKQHVKIQKELLKLAEERLSKAASGADQDEDAPLDF